MDSAPHLPNELCLEIWSYLPRGSLKAALFPISLTCREFYLLARPLIFADFDCHPYIRSQSGYMHPPPAAVARRALRRLYFWSSDEIAPFVRTCSFTPWGTQTPSAMSLRPPFVLDAFFEHLPRFTHLHHLYALEIAFTQMGLQSLCALPRLSTLHIDRCVLKDADQLDVGGLTLKVSTFIFRDRANGVEPSSHWAQILSRDDLRHLDASPYQALFEPTQASLAPFHGVERLILDGQFDASCMAVLAKFPAAHSLSFEGFPPAGPEASLAPFMSSQVLPALTNFTTSHALLHLARRPTITQLSLGTCPMWRLVAALVALGRPLAHITSLNLKTTGFLYSELKDVLSFFPQLTALHVSIEAHSGRAFLTALASAPAILPPTLERLALCWSVSPSAAEADVDSIVPLAHLVALRTAVVARCPGLAALWLDADDVLLRWRRSTQGEMVTETIARDMDSAWDIRRSEGGVKD
ncbi:hypothetical protein C8R46DRAFT_1108146 [Mycena filopes]|nr:hypothetical protein C8R46DRAFT_1108146 [Mycena filopes]